VARSVWLASSQRRRAARCAGARSTRTLPAEALDDAFRKLTRPEGGADLIVRNRALHRLLVDGVTVEYRDAAAASAARRRG
jgi:type I restriction enzyme R subunit